MEEAVPFIFLDLFFVLKDRYRIVVRCDFIQLVKIRLSVFISTNSFERATRFDFDEIFLELSVFLIERDDELVIVLNCKLLSVG